MNKNYELELPEGYEAVKTIDAKTTKFTVIMNIAAIVIFVEVFALLCFLFHIENIWEEISESILNYQYWLFLASLILYMVFHELLHGLAYKLLTHQKLTFGFTWSVVYCGVPHIYVYRKTSLIALLTPFVVLTVVLTISLFILQSEISMIYCSALLAMHLSGCVGDLYDSLLFLFKYKDPSTLMNDNGPVQVIYVNSHIKK